MRRLIKFPLYILSFILISAVSAYVTLQLLTSGMTVEVPDLTGKSLTRAEEILKQASLHLKVGAEDYDRNTPAGHIIRQDMPAGNRVKRGQGEINVVVSKGPEVRLIPSVTGETIDSAKDVLLQKGLEISKIIHVCSTTVDKGIVIAQKPAPEEWTGEPISLVVSKGPYEVIYYTPFFKGMVREDAVMLARELGFNVEMTESADSTGTVTGQKPEPGAKIKIGSTVYLQLGRKEYR